MLHLLAGKSQREAAEVAEVTESTVRRWCNHDATFIDELNKRRQGYVIRRQTSYGHLLSGLLTRSKGC